MSSTGWVGRNPHDRSASPLRSGRGFRPTSRGAAGGTGILLALLLAAAAPAGAETGGWFWKVRGFHLTDSTGEERVSFSGSEVCAGRSGERWRIEFALPAIAIDGPGTLVGTGAGAGAGAGAVVDRGSRGGHGVGQPRAATLDDGTRSGLGDARIAVRRWLGPNAAWGRTSLRGGVKLPTADQADGLGTGEADGWLGLGWSRQGWNVDLEAFVEWVELGSTSDFELDSGPAGGFAVTWPVRSVALEAGVEASASPVPGAATRTWALAALSGGGRARYGWRLTTFLGLSDSATDVGVTVTVVRR